MSKRMKKMLVAIATLVLSVSVVVGGTYALFTDEVTYGNHLQAGTLDITLERTSLNSYVLGADGYLTNVTDDSTVDFSETNTETANVFGITEDTLIVPGCSFDAQMKLANESSVAFDYHLEIVFKDGYEELANQIKVTVTLGGKTVDAKLANGLSVGTKNEPISSLGKNETQTFNVKIEFLEASNNNEVQGKSVDFDLIVYAVQSTKTK